MQRPVLALFIIFACQAEATLRSKTKNRLDINQIAYVEGQPVLGSGAGEGALNVCRSFAEYMVNNPAKPEVKVCGTGIKMTVYLLGRRVFRLSSLVIRASPDWNFGIMTTRSVSMLVYFSLWATVAAHDASVGDGPSFMMVSGISSPEEMCLTAADGSVDVEGAEVVLEPCAAAVAAGDGRELWQRSPNGQIANVMGKKCVGAAGDVVVLSSCDGGSTWETQGNGQLKLARAGNDCLSQKGSAAGLEDAAARGAIAASSTADAAAHGANMAVDGSSNTFWASALDPVGPVSITVDLGGQKRVKSVDIEWEFPAKSFTVSVSTDGTKWSEVHATDSSILSSSSIALGATPAAKVRVVMHEAAGSFHGHAVYGIKSLVVRAPRLQSIVEDCTAAAKSTDARDKYFATYVDEFAPCSSKALRSELPSLEAARASVASAVSELAEVLPKLGSCHAAALFMKNAGASGGMARRVQADARSSAKRSKSVGQVSRSVDSQNGVDVGAVAALLKEARRVIIAARGALF